MDINEDVGCELHSIRFDSIRRTVPVHTVLSPVCVLVRTRMFQSQTAVYLHKRERNDYLLFTYSAHNRDNNFLLFFDYYYMIT